MASCAMARFLLGKPGKPTVQRQLTRRLGTLSKEDEQRVRSLSITMLDRLADDLLDFSEPADLQRWFARYVTQ